MPRAHIEIVFYQDLTDSEVEEINHYFRCRFYDPALNFHELDWRDDRTLWVHLNIPLNIAYIPIKEVSGD